MKFAKYIVALFCLAIACASNARATDTPAAAPKAQTQADADAARKELDQMRQQMRDLSKRMAELSMQLGDVGPRTYAYRYIGDPDRGMMGVVLGRDEHGTRIDAVTPGGPADKAGIKAGDIVVSVDGKPSGSKEASEVFYNLKVGQEAKVVVQRDGRQLQMTLKAERREPFNFAPSGDPGEILPGDGNLLPPDFDKRIQIQVERASRAAQEASRHAMSQERIAEIAKHAAESAQHAMEHVSFSMPWWGLNLASLNPELGAYFGTEHGVLVLSADADASKTLKSGDVIVAIAGKKVERPEEALRLLREQPTGSDIKVEVLRQRKAQTLSMKAPEFKSMFVPAPPAPPALPAPIAHPAAPAPPAPPSHPLPATPAPPAVPPAPNHDIA